VDSRNGCGCTAGFPRNDDTAGGSYVVDKSPLHRVAHRIGHRWHNPGRGSRMPSRSRPARPAQLGLAAGPHVLLALGPSLVRRVPYAGKPAAKRRRGYPQGA
jgi:hypothetical protein